MNIVACTLLDDAQRKPGSSAELSIPHNPTSPTILTSPMISTSPDLDNLYFPDNLYLSNHSRVGTPGILTRYRQPC
jgi:hypothetical protein